MRLLLVRHGETVDNVAGNYAGITDSPLTTHGLLQAQRLGDYLSTRIRVSHIFSSDLSRAFLTAEAIRTAQIQVQSQSSSSSSHAEEKSTDATAEKQASVPSHTKKLAILREQDFGWYEGKAIHSLPKSTTRPPNGEPRTMKMRREEHEEANRHEPGFKPAESKEAMRGRMERFVDGYLLELLETVKSGETVVVVAHGIILAHLWRAILHRFPERNVSVAAGALAEGTEITSLEHLGGFSNTGYLELEITGVAKALSEGEAIPVEPGDAAAQLPPEISDSLDKVTVVDSGAPDTQGTKAPPEAVRVDTAEAERLVEPVIRTTGNATAQPPPEIPATPAEGTVVDPTAPAPENSAISHKRIGEGSTVPKLLDKLLVVKAINSLEHLKGLKKTRGGIGSSKHDASQKSIDSFFKKRRLE